MFTPEEVYSISHFMRLCKKTLDTHIPPCWLQGEVSNLSRPGSGHLYFTLKDDKAQIRCALFRSNAARLPFALENGVSILVRANPTLYEARGDFQVIIEQVETLGLGNLQRAFEQLKIKLKSEGLFEPSAKKTLPNYPKHIGIITSATGSVVLDIIHILKRRHPIARLSIFNTPTQGDACASNVISALNGADNYHCDVLIVARGGGSLEDLWCFNEETVARCIANLTTPIISAIGHETDTTIADFVADVRAPTPSAAAEICSPDRSQQLRTLDQYQRQLSQHLKTLVWQKQQQLDLLSSRIGHPRDFIASLDVRIETLNMRLFSQITRKINQDKLSLSKQQYALQALSPTDKLNKNIAIHQSLKQHLNTHIARHIQQAQYQLTALNARLHSTAKQPLPRASTHLQQLATALEHLSPLKTLGRGYSITLDNNSKAITRSSQVKIGDKINVRLNQGYIDAHVEQTKE